MEIECSCGRIVKLERQEYHCGVHCPKWIGFCSNIECNKKWEIVDATLEYEEMVMNEVMPPENGEHKDKEDCWVYKNGKYMEA